jgi:hypothetical protein
MSTSDLNLPDLSHAAPGTAMSTQRAPEPEAQDMRDTCWSWIAASARPSTSMSTHRLVARGEVVVVDDRLGVTMTEIIKNSDAAKENLHACSDYRKSRGSAFGRHQDRLRSRAPRSARRRR